MPERKGTIRVDASEVQGTDAFVVIQKMSYGAKRRAALMLAEAFGGTLPANLAEAQIPANVEFLRANASFTLELLAEGVLDWNWVDDKGTLMKLPADGGIDGLTDEEVEFLVRAIRGDGPAAEAKN